MPLELPVLTDAPLWAWALLLVLYAVLNNVAMVAIKAAFARWSRAERLPAFATLALGGGIYVAAIGTLLLMLKLGDASVVFPLAIGGSVLASNAIGAALYGEHIGVNKVIGTVLVLAGVTLAYMGGKPG